MQDSGDCSIIFASYKFGIAAGDYYRNFAFSFKHSSPIIMKMSILFSEQLSLEDSVRSENNWNPPESSDLTTALVASGKKAGSFKTPWGVFKLFSKIPIPVKTFSVGV